jgi:hypothetical protein
VAKETRRDLLAGATRAQVDTRDVEIPPRLPAHLQPVYRVFAACAARYGPEFFVSFRSIAERSQRTPRAAFSNVRQLAELGYLTILDVGLPGIRSNPRANHYQWHPERL